MSFSFKVSLMAIIKIINKLLGEFPDISEVSNSSGFEGDVKSFLERKHNFRISEWRKTFRLKSTPSFGGCPFVENYMGKSILIAPIYQNRSRLVGLENIIKNWIAELICYEKSGKCFEIWIICFIDKKEVKSVKKLFKRLKNKDDNIIYYFYTGKDIYS